MMEEESIYYVGEVTQLTHVNKEINAVYHYEDGSLERIPVFAMAVYDRVTCSSEEEEGREIRREKGRIRLLTLTDFIEGWLDLDEIEGFLGYELDGEERDWTKRIEEVKQRKEIWKTWRERWKEEGNQLNNQQSIQEGDKGWKKGRIKCNICRVNITKKEELSLF